METKKCSKCGVEKALCEFDKRKGAKDGHRGDCKVCRRERHKIYAETNRELLSAQKAAWKQRNKEKVREQSKAYRERNKEKIKAHYEANRDEILKKRKAHYEANKELYKERTKAYREANKDKIRERKRIYKNKRRATDPAYHLREVVSCGVRDALRKKGKGKRGRKTFSALPYTPADLVEHLERQFDETMTWENYGTYWDVDHIYPQSLLPYDSLDHPNFQKCWDLSNLQPLEKRENIKKSNKVITDPI